MFHIGGPGMYHLDNVMIRRDPIIITGLVLDRRTRKPIKNASIFIADSSNNLKSHTTDSIGFFRTELNHAYLGRDDIRVVVDTKDQYPRYVEQLFNLHEKKRHVNILLGMSAAVAARGSLFRINEDLVAFRSGPENGSPIQMMLSKGDMFLVTKVSGERSFGYLEIIDKTKGIHEEFNGWVLTKYLEYVD